MKNRTAVFIGHSELNSANIKEELKAEIVKLIEKGVDRFLNGGMGNFDMLSA